MPYNLYDHGRLLLKGKTDYLSQADCYFTGTIVERDVDVAIMLYQKAVAEKSIGAHFKLGLALEQAQKLPEASKAYYEAFLAGEPHAKAKLEGLLSGGCNMASYYLGKLYEHLKDKIAAMHFYIEALQSGHPAASEALNHLIEADADIAFTMAEHFAKASEMPKAYRAYAFALHHGHYAAKACLLAAAEAGKAEAQYVLACDYYHKSGDVSAAIPWAIRAAEQGHTAALTYLSTTPFAAPHYFLIARHYEQGLGCAVNLRRAIDFYRLAKSGGSVEALMSLGGLYEQMAEPDLELACQYYLGALRKGDRAAIKPLQRLAECVGANVRSAITKAMTGMGEHATVASVVYASSSSLPATECLIHSFLEG